MDDNKDLNPNSDNTTPATEGSSKESGRTAKRHKGLRVVLKTLMWIIIVILAIPVLLYVPPVQTFVKDLVCSSVRKSSGMDISIDRLRLKFPLRLTLDGVSVVEATGDTMARVKSAEIDVKLLPLLKMDAQVQKLRLIDGAYNMVSPDSSMILRIRAGELETDDKAAVDLRTMSINLNEARIADGNVQLYMDVWRQTPSNDTTPTKMVIRAERLRMERFTFGMSMLPTIDTLKLNARSLEVRGGVVDLSKNLITARSLRGADGDAVYLTPTPEYVAAHPAPVPDSTAVASPPMVIRGDSVSLERFNALYAIKGYKPLPGFDASYISVAGLSIGIKDFYNASSTLRLPVYMLQGTERSGLKITSGSGNVGITEAGLTLDDLDVNTPWSHVGVTAGLPFALMQMEPQAPLDAQVNATLGWPDIEAFMPTLATYTRQMPQRSPLSVAIDAQGRLDRADIKRMDVAVPGVLSLRANGFVADALDMKRLSGKVTFDGEVSNPALVQKLAEIKDMTLPKMRIKGTATADRQTYGADFNLTSTAGNVIGRGNVGLTSERYTADVQIDNFDVRPFAPTLGVGHVTARLQASGAGFNPERPGAATDIHLDLTRAEYNKHLLRDLQARVQLQHGEFTLDASSPNPACDFSLTGHGTIAQDDYRFDVTADVRHADLMALGLSPTPNGGSVSLTASGTASPARWLYDIDLDMPVLDWTVGEDTYAAPGGLKAKVRSTVADTYLALDGDRVNLLFESPYNAKKVIDTFSAIAAGIQPQLASRRLDMEKLQQDLPMFRLRASADDKGLLAGFLKPTGISMDSMRLDIGKDSIVKGYAELVGLNTGSIALDSVTLRLKQRGGLLDYALHIGNGPGPMSEFADVNVNGYLATNRLALSLNQRNIKGEQGYRLGMTGAIADSIATIHFTPLSAMIGYIPWKFNIDNHIDYNFTTHRVDANLQAKSAESSILLATEDSKTHDGNSLHVKLDNIKIEQFINIMLNPPPVAGTLDSDIHLDYDGNSLEGDGGMQLTGLTYDGHRVGDFDLGLQAGRDNAGDTRATVALKVNGEPAMVVHTELVPDSAANALQPRNTFLTLTDLPLSIANPFLGYDVARLSGTLSGRMDLTGTFAAPVLNGQVACDSVSVFVSMLGTALKFDEDPITVRDNVLRLNKFNILAANANPLTIDGTVDASRLTDVRLDLTANANNFQLLGNTARDGGMVYGKLFMDLNASAKGSLQVMDVNANLNVLAGTDVTYTLDMTTDALLGGTESNVVRFVNLSDTTQVATDDKAAQSMAMRINASATISPGTNVIVVIPKNTSGSGKVQLSPSGQLTFFQNYMGDQRLNGVLTLGEGYARYNVQLMGEKKFEFEPSSSVIWNGQMMNPTLNIHATDEVRASVMQGSTTQQVNFLVGLNITGNLESPQVQFDLSTNDDMSIQNALQSMSPDQRSTQAMNLLITGQYTAAGAKTVNSNMVTNQLYGMLAAQLNNLAARTIKGVDLSFGIDQYQTGTNGQTSTATSYSYQLSKSLFNNRFKILIGGNYTDNATEDENFAENLISDISFEYMLRQTSTSTLAVKLFRHMGYENILEGEVTETGVGIVMRRRLSNLRSLFRLWGRKRRSEDAEVLVTDSVPYPANAPALPHDSLPDGSEARPVDITRKPSSDK